MNRANVIIESVSSYLKSRQKYLNFSLKSANDDNCETMAAMLEAALVEVNGVKWLIENLAKNEV